MDLIRFGEMLSRLLPKIKTKLQLSGLVAGLAFALFVHFAKPGDNLALITAGSVGMSLVIFGQLFHFLQDFASRDRAKVFLISFAVFCVFTLAILLVSIFLLRQPTMSISKFDPPPEIEAASRATDPVNTSRSSSDSRDVPLSRETKQIAIPETHPPVSAPATKGSTNDGTQTELILPPLDIPRSADYSFSIIGGVPTLSARLMYSVNSRSERFPDGDFHEAVSWGSPWFSLDIANPSNENLFFTSLKTEALEVTLIREFIPKVPSIDLATPERVTLKIINEGWGRANNPTLDLRFGRPIGDTQYPNHDHFLVIGEKSFKLETIDERAAVELAPFLPPLPAWWHRADFKPSEFCKSDGYLEAIGRLRYTDDAGAAKTETFRTDISVCGGGGGNIFPSAAYNITLPLDASEYPVFTRVSNCIAAKSADELIVRLTAKRSGHFRLKFTLSSTSAVTVERRADVDILVPRFEHQTASRDGQFFKADGKAGCN